MFDNLREEAASSPIYEEEAKFQSAAGTTEPRKPGKFLGMTPNQRFIIAVMMMIAVCTLGMMCLLVTGKFSLF
jgi:hypothetical protein